jgi:HK97 family phage major capsid protein
MTVANKSLKEVTAEFEEKSRLLSRAYAEAGYAGSGDDLDMNKVQVFSGDNDQKARQFTALNKEINELGAEMDRLEGLAAQARENILRIDRFTNPESMRNLNGGGASNAGMVPASDTELFDPKRLGRFLAENKQYTAFRNGSIKQATIEIPNAYWNTIITLSSISPQATRGPMVELPLEDRTIADLMLQGNISTNTFEYYEETAFTNNADTVAEGALKPESAFTWTLRTETVRKVAHRVPTTDEALADNDALESMIRGRMAFGVRRKEEAQILHGDGVAPNLLGILGRGIQTQAKGSDPTPDAIYKAMQKVRGSAGSGFAEPTAVVIHPVDWTAVKLLRTTDGIYLWGNPSDEGPDRIWGKPVRQTTEMTQGMALVGAFRPYSEVMRRMGITVELSTENNDNFETNTVTIRAESRLLLAVYRPSAFASITGLS